MLWRIKLKDGAAGWCEVGTGKLFDDAGQPLAGPHDYSTTDTAPAQPAWYVEPVVQQDAPPLLSRKITQLAFKNRLTAAERIKLRQAAKANATVEDAIDLLDTAMYVDLDRADTRSDLMTMEAIGLLAAGRALEVLDAPVQEHEVAPNV